MILAVILATLSLFPATAETSTEASAPDWYLAERAALEDLYDAAGGPGWNATGWKSESVCHCGWHGVSCEDISYCWEADDRPSFRTRSCDDDHKNFYHCVEDYCAAMDPEGSTWYHPRSFCAERKPVGWIVDAATGRCVAATPPSSHCPFKRVTAIDLRGINISGVLPAWNGTRGALASLAYLDFSRVSFRDGIVDPHPWLGQGSVGLVGSLPNEWAALSSLTDLRVPNNRLVGPLPPHWGALSFLRYVDLGNNQLGGGSLPSSWAGMSSLTHLLAGQNRLTGSLPPEWAKLRLLKFIKLDQNMIDGSLPSEWVRMSSLGSLSMTYNQLGGVLPTVWADWSSSLFTLTLDFNKVSGTLPPEWARWSSANIMSLNSNKLSGELPAEWGSWSLTGSLQLNDNKLEGTLPKSWSNIPLISSLMLDGNKLSGTVPSNWGSLACNIVTFALNEGISGSLPHAWAGTLSNPSNMSRKLMSFKANGLKLSSTLPPEWGRMMDLSELYLYNITALSGTFPTAAWAGLSSLDRLYLRDCALSGALPAELPVQLSSLALQNNKFSGTLPAGWSQLSRLKNLNVNNNYLRGTLPLAWGAMSKLISLNLGSNYLSGTLPNGWKDGLLDGLYMLFLNSNRLEGTIPSSWWSDSNCEVSPGNELNVFDARHNHLTGAIPNCLLNSSAICILLLSDNEFVGQISAISANFFEPLCVVQDQPMTYMYNILYPTGTPFRPALLLQDNRLCCDLPKGPVSAKQHYTNREALKLCSPPEGTYTAFADQCRHLFPDDDANATNPAMIISGNMFNGPLPDDWGILVDPMWDEAPFLHFDRWGITNRVLPGFLMVVAYLCSGLALNALARACLTTPARARRRQEEERCWGIRWLRALGALLLQAVALPVLMGALCFGRRRQRGRGRRAGGRHVGLPQINRRLSRVYELSLRWLSAFALLLLAIHLPIYVTGTHLFTCGNPLLRTTAAYLADGPIKAFFAVGGTMVAAVLGIALIRLLNRIVAEEQSSAPEDFQYQPRREWASSDANAAPPRPPATGGEQPPLVRFAWAMAWLGVACLLTLPTALYAMSATIPVEGTGEQIVLSIVRYGAPAYLTLINSLAVPKLAKAANRKIGVPTSWLLLTSRLLVTWAVPALVVMALDNSCGQLWVKFWDKCNNPERTRLMNVQGPDGGSSEDFHYLTNTTLVDARTEICLQPDLVSGQTFRRTNPSQCARAVVSALAPLLVKKMAIAAFALPAITVLKWRMMPSGHWAFVFRRSNEPQHRDINLDDVMAQVMTWLDVAIVFGPQVPLLAPLVLLAIAGNRWSLRVGLQRLGKREEKFDKSAPALWSVVLSLFMQQALNLWLYQEMVVLKGLGNDGGEEISWAVRALTWAGAGLTATGVAWAMCCRLDSSSTTGGGDDDDDDHDDEETQRRGPATSEVELSSASIGDDSYTAPLLDQQEVVDYRLAAKQHDDRREAKGAEEEEEKEDEEENDDDSLGAVPSPPPPPALLFTQTTLDVGLT